MMDTASEKRPSHAGVTIATLQKMRAAGEKFTCVTAYDASFAALLDSAGVEVVLVGDSLGMVVQGHSSTIPVTMEDMVYHSRMVSRGIGRAFLMTDMPFMSYATVEQALANATRLMQEGGAHMVKLEGSAAQVAVVEALGRCGIPVCAHLGLRPQSLHKLGGYRVQGRELAAAEAMLLDATALEAAGADLLLLECIPAALTSRIRQSVAIPVIGIGAGPDCDAQVLVLYDMLGITAGKVPKFAKNFLKENPTIQAAVEDYVSAVKQGRFPGPEHQFV